MRSLKCDLEKSVLNIGFLGAVLLTCALGFTAMAYVDNNTSQSYSVLEVMFRLDRNFIRNNSTFSSMNIFQLALSGYITLFLPIIVAFPFMTAFCTERNSGNMRFVIIRSGKWRYYISKLLSAIIGGGLSVMLGVILFGLLAMALFPSLSSYNVSSEQFDMMLPGGYAATIFRMLLTAFLYGALSTLPALLLSSFCKNPYVITCLPFMLTYIRDTAVQRLTQAAFDRDDFEAVTRIYPFSSSAITNLIYSSAVDEQLRRAFIINGIMAVVFVIGFVFIMEQRSDKGV